MSNKLFVFMQGNSEVYEVSNIYKLMTEPVSVFVVEAILSMGDSIFIFIIGFNQRF